VYAPTPMSGDDHKIYTHTLRVRRWLDRRGARRRVLSTTKMALQYIMANAKLYTPREYPPRKVYIHVTSRLYAHAHKRTRCYSHTHTHTHTQTSLALGVQGKRVEIEKGRKLYVRGKRNARSTKYLRVPIHIRIQKHTYTFMYGIAATHI